MSAFVLVSAGVGYWLSTSLGDVLVTMMPSVLEQSGHAATWAAVVRSLIGAILVTALWLPMGWPLLRKLIRKERSLLR